jgi:hypothetical protein
MTSKTLITDATALPAQNWCRRVVPLNTAFAGGYDFDIPRSGPDRAAIMEDVIMLDTEAFAKKWAHLRRGPTKS